MKTPNERLTDLEDQIQKLGRELDFVSGMIPWAIHKALEGLMDQKKISYLEKRLIWEEVSKEINECLATSNRVSRYLDSELRRIAEWSQKRH